MARINVNIDPDVFNAVYLPYLEYTGYRNEVLYGGAGSGKSVFIAQKKVHNHLVYAKRKTLVIRKVGRTLRHSCYAEIQSVIRDWGLQHMFKINKSDMEIYNLVNQNSFLFQGLDDVGKKKSITGVTDIWIEEANEISLEEYRQLNLRLRGANRPMKQITLSFNPVSAFSWLKEEFFDRPKENTLILKTTYKDNKFLDVEDVQEIESLKDKDPVYWRIYGLGEWGVLGNLVYTNFEIRDFDPAPQNFKTIYNGLDWGYNDPAAGIKIGFKDGEIFVLNELYIKGRDNSELMADCRELFDPKNDLITADSSEPARIKEFRKNGWTVLPAKKGKDSLRFGIDFVRRHKIIIHPSCQNFINEIQGYAYRQDRDGNILEEPVDFRNHLMDAMRYALEKLAYERRLRWAS